MGKQYGEGLYGQGLYGGSFSEMSGTVMVDAAVSGTWYQRIRPFAGTLSVPVSFAAATLRNLVKRLTGVLPVQVALRGDLTAGPLWGPEPTDPGPWTPETSGTGIWTPLDDPANPWADPNG